MREIKFRIWNKRTRKMLDDLHLDKGLTISEALEENEEWEFLQYIGLKDKDGVEIYSNSSIVEFDFVNILGDPIKVIGYFSYCKNELQYKLCQYLKKENRFSSVSMGVNFNSRRYMGGLKVIDTIQENKLGLFKEKLD